MRASTARGTSGLCHVGATGAVLMCWEMIATPSGFSVAHDGQSTALAPQPWPAHLSAGFRVTQSFAKVTLLSTRALHT